jgi:hypothetical protein
VRFREPNQGSRCHRPHADLDKLPFSDPKSSQHEYKRLKFSINKTAYTEQIAHLRRCNQALTRLTKQSLELETARADNKARSCPNFIALQSYTYSLYDALHSAFRCVSGCPGHAVKLRMENRNARIEAEDALPERTPFRIIFTDAADFNWKEADVKCIVVKSRMTANAPTTNAAGTTRPHVHFSRAQTHSHQNPIGQGIPMVNLQSSSPHGPGASSSPIHDLCAVVWQASPQQAQQQLQDAYLGYILDTAQRRHGILSLKVANSDHQQHGIAYSLNQILTKQISNTPRLTQLATLKLAVDLSSSVLQLYKTPWLPDDWDEKNVYFVDRAGTLEPSIYDFPYIHRQFSSSAASLAAQTPQQRYRIIRNQTLYTLGILLIELWYGKTIKDLQTIADLDSQGTPGPAWCAAERIVETEIEFDAGRRYADAVRRCIRCDFDRNMKDMSLGTVDFQKAVFYGVLLPLEQTLEDFVRKSSPASTVP